MHNVFPIFFAMQRGRFFFDKADKKNLQNRMA